MLHWMKEELDVDLAGAILEDNCQPTVISKLAQDLKHRLNSLGSSGIIVQAIKRIFVAGHFYLDFTMDSLLMVFILSATIVPGDGSDGRTWTDCLREKIDQFTGQVALWMTLSILGPILMTALSMVLSNNHWVLFGYDAWRKHRSSNYWAHRP